MKPWSKVLYFAAIGGQVVIRAPYERRRPHIPKTEQRVTRAEQGLLAGITIGGLVLPLVYSLTPWLNFADYPLPPRTQGRLGRLGVLLLVADLWLFWRAHHDLGANWSPTLEIGAEQTLTTEGVYGTIRHPMYASQLLWGLAQVLLLPNWIVGWTGLLAFLGFYLVRVPEEEQMMLDHFGDAYRAYAARTGRIIPLLAGAGATEGETV